MSRSQLTSTVEQNTGGAVAPFVAGKNKIINGDFGIWQRGTSFTATSAADIYLADRFDAIWDGSGSRAMSQQTFDYSASPAADKLPITGYPSTYFLRYAQTVAGTGATYSVVRQKIEDVKTFAGQTVTLSFWLKADSNRTINAPALQQNFGSGGSGGVTTVAGSGISATTSWQRFSFTIAVPSISGQTIGNGSNLQAQIFLPINTTFTVDTWGVQLEAGSVATPFTTATGTLSGELAACQRYYYRTSPTASGVPVTTNGGCITTTIGQVNTPFPVTMRTNPSAIDYSAINWYNYGNNTEYNTGTFTMTAATPNFASVRYTHGSAIFTAGQAGAFDSAGSSSYLGFTAEL